MISLIIKAILTGLLNKVLAPLRRWQHKRRVLKKAEIRRQLREANERNRILREADEIEDDIDALSPDELRKRLRESKHNRSDV